MDEQELRAMIRDSIARHQGGPPRIAPAAASSYGHASHLLLPLLRGGDEADGACLIEPAVRCNHCGYCVSYGH